MNHGLRKKSLENYILNPHNNVDKMRGKSDVRLQPRIDKVPILGQRGGQIELSRSYILAKINIVSTCVCIHFDFVLLASLAYDIYKQDA